jgi:hypothetical protein
LTYTIRKERKMQALELQEADRKFRKFKEQEERGGKGKKSFFGRLSAQRASEQGFKSMSLGSNASKKATTRQGGEEDEERLVGGEAEPSSQMKVPAGEDDLEIGVATCLFFNPDRG